MKEKSKKAERKISFVEGLVLLVVIIGVIFLNAMKFKIGTGLSVLSVAMILGAYGMLALHIPWDDMMAEILKVFQNGMGAVMNPLRLALVGESKGPHMFDITEILGKEETLRRLKKAIEVIPVSIIAFLTG